MKILFISSHLPYENAKNAGARFIYDFMQQLKARGVAVSLISFVRPGEGAYTHSADALCERAMFIDSKPIFTQEPLGALFKKPFYFMRTIVIGFCRYRSLRRKLDRGLRLMLKAADFDIVQVEYSSMAIFMHKIRFAKLKCLDLHDVMIKPAQREYEGERNALLRLFKYAIYAMVRMIEISFCRRFDILFVKSAVDKKVLERAGGFHARILPLGTGDRGRVPAYNQREAHSILFVGAMYRELNERAVLYVIEEIMPRLAGRFADLKFYIVGDSPSERLQKRASGNVVVVGYAEDLSDYYARCKAFVAPLFIGGGMIFKVLESMSYGLPVVATTIANEGIRAVDGREVLIADTPDAFCAHITTLLQDELLWESVSASAKKFVIDTYSWNSIVSEYLNVCSARIKSQ